jgi:hypothetical protein
MLAYLLAVIPLLEDAFASRAALAGIAEALAADGALKALSSLTFEEWLALAEKLAAAAPAVHQAWAALHPALDQFAADLKRHGAEVAARQAPTWFANQPQEIPSYGAGGNVVPIRNPDYKGA